MTHYIVSHRDSQIASAPENALLVSPLEGQTVRTTGIVTAVDSNAFYLQDPVGDGDDSTSDAIVVFTQIDPGVAVGDFVAVVGEVGEFFPGGASTRNQPTTEILNNPQVTVESSGNPLPDPVLIGMGGRSIPTESMLDGLNFWESLEAMRVTCVACMAIAPTNRFGEIFAVADSGASATGLNSEMGLTITPSDFNPEKIQIDENGVFRFDLPNVNSGAMLGDVTGVVGYNFGNYEIYPTELFDAVNNTDVMASAPQVGPPPEVSDELLTAATYNVLNLDPNDADGDEDVASGRFAAIADHLVNGMGSPDVVGLQEIQDNTGSEDDGVSAANETLQTLVDAITAAGGPTYEFIDNTFIQDGASGGQPGAFTESAALLYNPNRVVI